jgi:hypothetical protein
MTRVFMPPGNEHNHAQRLIFKIQTSHYGHLNYVILKKLNIIS